MRAGGDMLEPREADIPALFLVFVVPPLLAYVLIGKWSGASKKSERVSPLIPGMVLVDAFAFGQILGFYNYSLLRGKVVARNDGMRPSLYQEAATGLIAGAAGAYLSFPFAVACQHKQVESMGPIAERYRIRSKSVLHILTYGGPWLKRRAGLGMRMVATYNPSLHYHIESHGFIEEDAKSCTISLLIS